MTTSQVFLVSGVATAARRFYDLGDKSMPELLSLAGFIQPDANVSPIELRKAFAQSPADAEAWVRWSNERMGGTGRFLALDEGNLIVDLLNHEYQSQQEFPTRLDAIAEYAHHEVYRLRRSC